MPKTCSYNGCNNPVWSKGRCKYHPLAKSGSKGLKKTPIKKISDKRRVQEKEYSKLRREHLKNNPKCVVCGCEADQIHHRMQIRYGKFLNDSSQFMSVCAPCHRIIHDNVAFSIREGYLASAEEKAKYLKKNL
jgi:hypothetical protein